VSQNLNGGSQHPRVNVHIEQAPFEDQKILGLHHRFPTMGFVYVKPLGYIGISWYIQYHPMNLQCEAPRCDVNVGLDSPQ